MDAQQLSDGKTVYLKHTKKDSPEVEIVQYLSSEELRNDPRNHCQPSLDVLRNEDDPEHVILVIPWLRRIDSPEPASVRDSDPSRTAVGGVRYYFIDFGVSTKDQDEVLGIHGQELSPELSDTVPHDPYKLDVYILGMAYQHFLVERHSGLDLLRPLIEYMTPLKPSERPSAAEALQRWNTIVPELSFFTLSQRLYPKRRIGFKAISNAQGRLL
ncbi:hypothetical protein M407DRAFT_34398 [Tulasnella calospora MUT 4182]|uniref:Protein kinase domain-containing protein n=1 Tax=Tulasnella calospora MUT 4182 TaxID=1051891 RepID=A0A0C3L2L9_9AGAM|nr:hypothetical protein M407DRAFT_34398 [Tulasnella calospora MUT 4182]